MFSRTFALGFALLAPVSIFAQLGLSPVVSTLVRPVAVAQPPGDTNRIFVVEQRGTGGTFPTTSGRIRIIKNGALLATNFLLVSGLTNTSEEGLLGLAFDPNYATNGTFYVYCTTTVSSVAVSQIRKYTVSAGNPDVANTTGDVIFQVNQPFNNHNGGTLRFGPDGYLYLGLGDGGSGNDPGNRALDINTTLGKIIRIDVTGDDFPADATKDYRIPPTNPFVGVAGEDEIWSIGVRNPWKWSFDRPDRNGFGGMFICDVGQDVREEVNYEPPYDVVIGQRPATPYPNYGWRVWEGTRSTGLSGYAGLATPKFPIYEYTHAIGLSISGGTIYRGTRLGIQYWGDGFFGDYTGNFFYNLDLAINPITALCSNSPVLTATVPATASLTPSNPVAFETLNDGEIYVCEQGFATGSQRLSRIVATTASRQLSGTIQYGNLDISKRPRGVSMQVDITSTSGIDHTIGVGTSPSGAFTIPVPTGVGKIAIKPTHFLQKVVAFNSTSADVSGVTMNLINGDVDEDNEIASGDFDAVVLQFGNAGTGDVDEDGEVGASDFDIIVANFGLSGDVL